jgi:hypothetical protein
LLAEVKHKPDKSDLNATYPPTPPLTVAERDAIRDFQNLMGGDPNRWKQCMQGELVMVAGQLGDDFYNKFLNNPTAGAEIDFGANGDLSRKVATLPGYKAEHKRISGRFIAALQAQANGPANAQPGGPFQLDWNGIRANVSTKSSDGRDATINPACVDWTMEFGISIASAAGTAIWPDAAYDAAKDALALRGVIGSFQGSEVWLKYLKVDKATRAYTAQLEYVLFDHFGVDNSDVLCDTSLHGSTGQCAMWMLQHRVKPGCNPFVTKVRLIEQINGKL